MLKSFFENWTLKVSRFYKECMAGWQLFPQLLKMWMRKNVNDDVRKDFPIYGVSIGPKVFGGLILPTILEYFTIGSFTLSVTFRYQKTKNRKIYFHVSKPSATIDVTTVSAIGVCFSWWMRALYLDVNFRGYAYFFIYYRAGMDSKQQKGWLSQFLDAIILGWKGWCQHCLPHPLSRDINGTFKRTSKGLYLNQHRNRFRLLELMVSLRD